jgi:hypothetical protein
MCSQGADVSGDQPLVRGPSSHTVPRRCCSSCVPRWRRRGCASPGAPDGGSPLSVRFVCTIGSDPCGWGVRIGVGRSEWLRPCTALFEGRSPSLPAGAAGGARSTVLCRNLGPKVSDFIKLSYMNMWCAWADFGRLPSALESVVELVLPRYRPSLKDTSLKS